MAELIRMKRLTPQGQILPLQRKSEDGVKLTVPSNSADDPTDRMIADPYASGTLDQQQWNAHVATARNATDQKVRQREYELLFTDVAKLANARTLLGDDNINWLAGAKPSQNKNYKPWLNLTPWSTNELGANAKTGFVNAAGEFGVVPPLESSGARVGLAIVMPVDVFDHGKEIPLGILRHEMMHAAHESETLDALAAFQANDKKSAAKDRKDPPGVRFNRWVEQQQKRGSYSPADAALIKETAQTSLVGGSPNSELLAYFEGFMTRFHLIKPPIEMSNPLFVELLGALQDHKTLPWRFADNAVRSEALGRFQKYFAALDEPHRRAFEAWVALQLTKVQSDRGWKGEPGGSVDENILDNPDAADAQRKGRENQMYAHFFRSLQDMLAQAAKTTTPMALPAR